MMHSIRYGVGFMNIQFAVNYGWMRIGFCNKNMLMIAEFAFACGKHDIYHINWVTILPFRLRSCPQVFVYLCVCVTGNG